MKRCTRCGHKNDDKLEYCAKCYSQLPPAGEETDKPRGAFGKRQIIIAIIVAVIAILAITKPSMDSYVKWIITESSSGDSYDAQSQAVAAAGNAIANELFKSCTRESNYLIFAVYDTTIPGGHRVAVVGIFNTFILIKSSIRPS